MTRTIRSFLRHMARAQHRLQQPLRDAHKASARALPEAADAARRPESSAARTNLDELSDKLTSILVDENLLGSRQQNTEDAVMRLHDQVDHLQDDVAAQTSRLKSLEAEEHDGHVRIAQALGRIEGTIHASSGGRTEKDTRCGEDVRTKKIREITGALLRIEAEHARLSKRKRSDPKQLTRLARMIQKHRRALKNL